MRVITAAIAVTGYSEFQQASALALANRLSLPYIPAASPEDDDYQALLQYTDQGLQLQQTGRKRPGPVWVDFTAGAVAHRRKFGGGKGQMIAKAVGMKGSVVPHVLDVTAGLGKDAFVLATLGCQVTLVERSPIIHALLDDGIERARQHPDVADLAQNMTLIPADSCDWLLSQDIDSYDVLYLDPMYPHSDKSAQVKKEMALFQSVVGEDNDGTQLLSAAWPVAKYRLVVKRPRKAPSIDGFAYSHQIVGKSTRYDIYAKQKMT